MVSVSRFAITGYSHFWVGTTLYLEIYTDISCHAFVRWTDHEPRIHLRSLARRGYDFMKDPDYCFIEWNELEQLEPGDTRSHLFIWPDWSVGQTRWYYFYATISGLVSPSQYGIFRATCPVQGKAPLLSCPPGTVLKNPGFEDWPNPDAVPPHWSFYQMGGGFSGHEREEVDVHGGTYSARIYAGGNNTGAILRQLVNPLGWVGFKVLFKMWGKGLNKPNNDFSVGVNGTGGWLQHDKLDVQGVWEQKEIQGLIPEDATQLWIGVRCFSEYWGPVYGRWDDLTFECVP